MRNAIFTILILLISSQFLAAQDKPKAELVDEVGVLNCEDFLVRIQKFLGSLNSYSDSVGNALIFTNPTNKDDDKYFKRFKSIINGQLDLSNFDENKVLVRRFETNEKFKIQFWIVSKGAEIPFKFKEETVESLPQITKPTLFHQDIFENSICPSDALKSYAKILGNNSNLQGNIVIFDFSMKNILDTQNRLIKEFEEKYKISSNRLKFFHKKGKDVNTEYWLVPKKSRD